MRGHALARHFFAFNNALLTQQPDVDSDGLTDAELADLAIASGATTPKVVRECIEDQAFATGRRMRPTAH